MTLQQKITTIFFLLLIGLPVGGWWYYKHSRPKPVPLPPRQELTITIIPGWNLRDVAAYLVNQGLASTTDDVYAITGKPAVNDQSVSTSTFGEMFSGKPSNVSFEGYLAPETYRVYRDASLVSIIQKFLQERQRQLKSIDSTDIASAVVQYSWHDILTVASIVERESAGNQLDRQKVADILWRRIKAGFPLQVDSSVHYAISKTGDVYTTDKERAIDSPWNTYKYRGLPPGPICNPSVEAIQAADYPFPNSYWYFLSGSDGVMRYAKTLEEHNRNRAKYL